MWVTLTLNVARVIPTSDVAGVKILNYNSAGVTILSYYVSVVAIGLGETRDSCNTFCIF